MVTASALAALALAFCHNFGWPDPSSVGKSEHRGYAASPSYLSCTWLLPAVSPCAVPSQATLLDTLLSPALEHPLVLPVAPAYLHTIYGPAQPASLRVSLLQ